MGLRQSKDGYVLNLAVHPDDLPEDLMRDFVGSRYMVVMVRIGDDEQPLDRDAAFPGDNAVKVAGMLCRDKDFWAWIFHIAAVEVDNEEACREWLCAYLGIEARRELKTSPDARDLFNKLHKGFNAWRKS
jgi:hypothetical protein